MQSIQNWYVSSIGQVYASPTIPFSSQPTAIVGTIVPTTPAPFPTGNPQSIASPVGADLSRTPPIDRPSSLVVIHTQSLPVAHPQFIRRYDPNTSNWSDVTRPPTQGFMLQLTPVQSTGGAILWFVGMNNNGQEILYRYVV
jgi:hypothetical protein